MASSSLRALISCSYCFIRSWEEMGGRLRGRRESGEARGCYTAPCEMSYLGVVEYVLHRFIGDTHHPSGKPQCGDLHEDISMPQHNITTRR